jgi:transcription elongation GreA/GreB family factor
MQRLLRPEIPVDELLDALDARVAEGGGRQADERAKLLQDELWTRQATPEALRVLEWRARLLPADRAGLGRLRDEAMALFRDDPARMARAEQAGWDKPIPPIEAARRLRTLMTLEPGVLCLERSWGFGVVRQLDELARKVEIDFETKAGAWLTYAYAAEGLTLLAPDHLYARQHHDPAALEAMTKENPGEVVRIALRSFGPMIPDAIKRRICPKVVPEANWKTFWDGARKSLKKDPRMAMPAKRTVPWVLHPAREKFGPEWFSDLAVERDLDDILAMAGELSSQNRLAGLEPDARATLAERLAFVIHGADTRRPGLVGEAVLRADEAGLPEDETGAARAAERWADDDALRAVLRDLPARELEPFLRWMHGRGGDAFLDRVRGLIPKLDITPLTAVMHLLLPGDADDAGAAEMFRQAVQKQQPTVEMLLWLHKNPARLEDWALARPMEFARLCLAALEEDSSGERLKARNQLRDRFEKTDWLKAVLNDMTPEQRGEFMLRVKGSSGWPMIERQAVVGHMVKLFPELEAWLQASGAAAAAAAPLTAIRVTSNRTYRQRQRQLHKLSTEEIPANSREIGHARSYGDLRENFEYKAAKEAQAVLMRRQAELEQMLREVQATDFRQASADQVGPGVRVELESDAGPEVYHILGVWDRDEALRIISCESKLAETLAGLRAGAEASVPGDAGMRRVRVAAVRPLPPDIVEWANGDAPAG